MAEHGGEPVAAQGHDLACTDWWISSRMKPKLGASLGCTLCLQK